LQPAALPGVEPPLRPALRPPAARRTAAALGAGTAGRAGGHPAFATLRDFDELFTARTAGFQDRADYYARCACGPELARIRIPTVILSAEDDPLAPAADVRKVALSSSIHFHLEPHGGHMGYISHDSPGRRWLEPALLHFATRHAEPSRPRHPRPDPAGDPE
jgi:predicted alpha/beta-fold hydrolase